MKTFLAAAIGRVDGHAGPRLAIYRHARGLGGCEGDDDTAFIFPFPIPSRRWTFFPPLLRPYDAARQRRS